MLMMTPDGVVIVCVVCHRPMTAAGVGLYRPLRGPDDAAELFPVHEECRQAEVITLLLPRSSSRRWGTVLEDLRTPAEEGP